MARRENTSPLERNFLDNLKDLGRGVALVGIYTGVLVVNEVIQQIKRGGYALAGIKTVRVNDEDISSFSKYVRNNTLNKVYK